MKRTLSFCISICLLFVLCGCNASSLHSSGPLTCSYDNFYSKFSELIGQLSDQFTLSELESDELEATHSLVIEGDDWLNDFYSLSIYCDSESKIEKILFSAERKENTDINFALIAFYVYTSFGFPDRDADEFYETYDLLSTNDITKSEDINGWNLSITMTDTLIHFTIEPSQEKN